MFLRYAIVILEVSFQNLLDCDVTFMGAGVLFSERLQIKKPSIAKIDGFHYQDTALLRHSNQQHNSEDRKNQIPGPGCDQRTDFTAVAQNLTCLHESEIDKTNKQG
jgi:hypothetical protein